MPSVFAHTSHMTGEWRSPHCTDHLFTSWLNISISKEHQKKFRFLGFMLRF